MTRIKTTKSLIAMFALLVLGFSQALWGQAVSATLVGTVTDNTGAVVPKASVTILENATGIAHTDIANGSGNYTFPDLTPGNYTVTIWPRASRRKPGPASMWP
ncbi:MAG: carboxypeptidase-like regulatory domain-containing protein [Terracidiphilus sp.]